MPFNFDAAMAGLFDAAQNFSSVAMKSALEKEATAQSLGLQAKYNAEGRLQAHGFAMEQQKDRQAFEGTEGDKNRLQQKYSSDTAAAATRYSADASAAASRFSTEKSAEMRQKELDQTKPLVIAQIANYEADKRTKDLANTITEAQQEATKNLEKARAGGDADAIAKAEDVYNLRNSQAAMHGAATRASNVERQTKEFDLGLAREQADLRKQIVAAKDDPEKVKQLTNQLGILNEQVALRQSQIEENRARTQGLQADADGKLALKNARDDLLFATETKNPELIARATEAIRILSYSTTEERQHIALWQTNAKTWETAIKDTQLAIKNAAASPELQARLQGQLVLQQAAFKNAMEMQDTLLKQFDAGRSRPPPGVTIGDVVTIGRDTSLINSQKPTYGGSR